MALPNSTLSLDKRNSQETEQTRNSISKNHSNKMSKHKVRDLVPASPKAILAKSI